MKDFVQLLKLPPSILAAIVLGSGLILFLPQNILQKLGLASIPELWRTILGGSFIISSSLLIIYFGIRVFKVIFLKFYMIRFKLKFPKVMNNLRSEELIIVALLYRSPNYTSRLPYSDGVTLRLNSKKIIQFTSADNFAYGESLLIPFTITPIAQDYLDKHPKLLSECDESELQSLYTRLNDPFCN